MESPKLDGFQSGSKTENHRYAQMDVPYEQSVLMAKELERHGIHHEWISIPGRGHGFDEGLWDPAVAGTLDRALRFIERQVKP